jgi:hypothetical protein
MLAFYSRPHYDDYHFLWQLREMSIFQYVSDMYFNQTGRFVSTFINGVVSKTILTVGDHRFFPVLFWLTGVVLCWLASKEIFSKTPRFFLLNIVMLFYNIYVLTNIDFAVFNWLCAMTYYLLMPVLLVILTFVNKPVLKNYQKILLYLAVIFAGGSQETFTPVAIAILFFNLIYYFYINKFQIKKTYSDIRVRRITVILLLMLLLLAIVVIAPGNYVRLTLDEFVKPDSIADYLKGFTKAIGTFFYYQVFYLPYYLVLIFVLSDKKLNTGLNIIENIRTKQILLILSLYGIYLLLSVFPFVYLWSGFGIQRNYTHIVFTTMLVLVISGVYLLRNRQKILAISANAGLSLLIVIMVFNLITDTSSAYSYACSVDKRIENILDLKDCGNTKEIQVEPLNVPYTLDVKYQFYRFTGFKKSNPQPVLYYISDTGSTPNEYASHLSKYYNLGFMIVLKQ